MTRIKGKTLLPITEAAEKTEHLGSIQLAKHFEFKYALEQMQRENLKGTEYQRISWLLNKGRYFEIYNIPREVMHAIAWDNKIAYEWITYKEDRYPIMGGMWYELEGVLKTVNRFGYYVEIKLDWI